MGTACYACGLETAEEFKRVLGISSVTTWRKVLIRLSALCSSVRLLSGSDDRREGKAVDYNR